MSQNCPACWGMWARDGLGPKEGQGWKSPTRCRHSLFFAGCYAPQMKHSSVLLPALTLLARYVWLAQVQGTACLQRLPDASRQTRA